MFQRPHHNSILGVLLALDSNLLRRAECWFGGGTAIVLQLGEYRDCADIAFCCASQEGYQLLREVTFDQGFRGLVRAGTVLEEVRELRTNQYGMQAAIAHGGSRVSFSITREARNGLSGAIDPDFGVPTLGREDMYTGTLLANADHWKDAGMQSRHIIDLSMMITAWGDIPAASWAKARDACGDSAPKAYEGAVGMIRDPEWLARCMENLAIDPALSSQILAPHGGPMPRTPSPVD